MSEKHEAAKNSIDSSENELVLSSLELDQLAEAKSQRLPRRRLKGAEIFVLMSRRIYLLFMMAVVIYQVWTGAR